MTKKKRKRKALACLINWKLAKQSKQFGYLVHKWMENIMMSFQRGRDRKREKKIAPLNPQTIKIHPIKFHD